MSCRRTRPTPKHPLLPVSLYKLRNNTPHTSICIYMSVSDVCTVCAAHVCPPPVSAPAPLSSVQCTIAHMPMPICSLLPSCISSLLPASILCHTRPLTCLHAYMLSCPHALMPSAYPPSAHMISALCSLNLCISVSLYQFTCLHGVGHISEVSVLQRILAADPYRGIGFK
jgi:hypothetical protein